MDLDRRFHEVVDTKTWLELEENSEVIESQHKLYTYVAERVYACMDEGELSVLKMIASKGIGTKIEIVPIDGEEVGISLGLSMPEDLDVS